MDTKTPKLTYAQRAALFTVGAFHSWQRYGTWGRRAQSRCRLKLKYDLKFVQFNLKDCIDELTEEGKARFDAEFGTPCSKHGWAVGTGEHGCSHEGVRFCAGACPECVRIVERVRGYTIRHEPETCVLCKRLSATQVTEISP